MALYMPPAILIRVNLSVYTLNVYMVGVLKMEENSYICMLNKQGINYSIFLYFV